MFEEHIFNLSLFCCNPFVTNTRSSGHNNYNLKIMHFSVKNNIFHLWTKMDCKFGNFAKILFSRIALKHIFATLKIHDKGVI